MFQHNPLTFFGHVFEQPVGLILWLFWLAAVNTLSLVFLRHREGRWVLAAWVGNILFMSCLYSIVGYTRLLGLSHVLFWTPLVVFLARRLTHLDPGSRFGRWIVVLLSTNTISLLIDYIDVVRYLLGDRT
ncbi:MAG: hypothetical protein D6795_20015 [Deltaproteobacteria bacterium]|nr:MAG: hypothetical protein D6795_20015 [Deltaproteobacteria bacterium]